MSQAERLSRINFLLQSKGFVSSKAIQETFEISRATFQRDIEFMRNRLGAPLVYDPEKNVYRYDKNGHAGQTVDEVPGLWITPREGYALLTLFNVLRGIDPGFLGHYLNPLLRTIKRLLSMRNFRMWNLDRKVKIDLPNFTKTDHLNLGPVFSALVTDEAVQLDWLDTDSIERTGRCEVTQLILRESGWELAIKPTDSPATTVRLDAIRACRSFEEKTSA